MDGDADPRQRRVLAVLQQVGCAQRGQRPREGHVQHVDAPTRWAAATSIQAAVGGWLEGRSQDRAQRWRSG
eukprot:7014512-Alexandrium_andersonii.AAC.1